MQEDDFSEALGRLLTDGKLRDDFGLNPEAVVSSLCQDPKIQSELAALKSEELEVQAEILLRKRWGVIKNIIPVTIARLEPNSWPLFRQYARYHWLPSRVDAAGFTEYLIAKHSDKIDKCELNRLRFSLATRSAIDLHLISVGGWLPALQILVRFGNGWREYILHLRF